MQSIEVSLIASWQTKEWTTNYILFSPRQKKNGNWMPVNMYNNLYIVLSQQNHEEWTESRKIKEIGLPSLPLGTVKDL